MEEGTAALSEMGPRGDCYPAEWPLAAGPSHQTFLANGVRRRLAFAVGRGGRGGGRGTILRSAATETPETGPFHFLPIQLYLPGGTGRILPGRDLPSAPRNTAFSPSSSQTVRGKKTLLGAARGEAFGAWGSSSWFRLSVAEEGDKQK